MLYGNWSIELKEKYEKGDINIDELSEDERNQVIMMLFTDYQIRINDLREESKTLNRLCIINLVATIALAVALALSVII